jgi:hypothetical protein
MVLDVIVLRVRVPPARCRGDDVTKCLVDGREVSAHVAK